MPITRLILLIVVMGGLTLMLVQNLSPTLSLVFLGMRTIPLPLSLWILLSITAGAATTVLISSLLKFINYPPVSAPKPSPTNSESSTASPRDKSTTVRNSASNTKEYTEKNEFDDWETDDNEDNDWEESEQSSTFEPQSTSKNASQSSSVYSYSYKEPKNTAAGKSESIYDADYRVIVPPYQPSDREQTEEEDEDDWNFLEDDDFEGKDERF